MFRFRVSEAAQGDVLSILAWTHEQFGEAARVRYESLIVAALRDVASQPDRPGSLERPELGTGVRSWHLQLSRNHVEPGVEIVRRPRHFLVYRSEPALVVVGRVLHDAMESDSSWPAPDGSSNLWIGSSRPCSTRPSSSLERQGKTDSGY